MSKVKKVVSLMLAAVMLLSVAPFASAYVYEANQAGDKFGYSSESVVVNPTPITVDTYETTETVRICDATNSVLDGNFIVSANSAGIAQTSGNFANFAYGADAPTDPVIVMKINGISDTSLISNLTVTCSQINGFNAGSPAVTTQSGSIRYVWTMAGNKTWSVPGGNNTKLIYNISFTYAKKAYTAHAYATAKYIVRPNGMIRVGKWDPSSSDRDKSFAHMTQLYCAQSVPGFAGTGGDHTYFQYDATATAGNALSGGGFDDTGNGTVLVANNSIGGLTWFRTSYDDDDWDTWNTWGRNPNEAEAAYRPKSLNGDAPRTSIYIDKRNDHLGKGTASGKTNGLNMRMVWKTTDKGSSYPQKVTFMEAITLRANANLGSNLGSSVASVGNSSTGTMTVDLSHVYHNGSGFNNLSNMNSQGRKSDGTGGYVNADGDTLGPNFVMHTFSGTGALTNNTTWSIDYLIKSTNNSSLADSNWLKSTNTLQVTFLTYDTTNLYNAINAIDNGTSTTINGSTIGNKGKFPQSWMYSGGWAAFESAYNSARSVIAKFDVNQTEVDNALNSLISAYNGLTGYVASGTFQVKHCLKNTTEELVPAQTFQYTGNWSNPSSTPIANGASITLYALDNIEGYVSVGATTFTGSVSFNTSGAVIADNDNNTYGSSYTFYYEPGQYTLSLHTGQYGQDENDEWLEYVLSKRIYQGVNLNDVSENPNFSTMKSEIENLYGGPAHTVYAGIYDNASYTGSPVDGINISTGASEWRMPTAAAHLYMKWAAMPVKLKVITSYGATDTNVSSPVIPAMGAAPQYSMGAVTFDIPANPPTSTGMQFVNYYTDSTYTTPVEWPITADYYGTSDYTITDDGSGFGYVTVYAKYVDLTDKIVFDPNGGTLEDGTTSMGFTVADNVLDYSEQMTGSSLNIDFPTPVREGYTFKGWILSDGTAIQGWTTGNATAGYNPVYIDAANLAGGVHAHTGHTGFIAYAVWSANPITITFYHDIPSGEESKMNSTNVSGTNYYYQMDVVADSQVDTSFFPSTPRRYGYEFQYWTLNGRRFDTNGKYPKQDTELIARWEAADDIIFTDLTTYVNLEGTDTKADLQHAPDSATTPIAMKGDKVRIQFNAGGMFYAASSSWVFVYDADFFNEIDNVEVAKVNSENGYIEALGGADVTVIDNSVAYGAYNGAMGTVTDPYTGETITNPGYLQVIIDPDINNMTSYNTVGFNYPEDALLQITLKINPNTTKDKGSLWLPTELIRTPENIMGDSFIAYSPNARSIREVETDKVRYDHYPVTTVNILDQTRPTTTITAALPVEGGVTLGQFADGTTANKSFIGPEATEILTTYTVDNATYYDEYTGAGTPTFSEGFPEPVREGYHIAGWYNNGDHSDAWSTDTENGGPTETYSYASADQDGKTYTVEWEPDPYTLYFYNDANLTDLRTTVDVVYDQTNISAPRIPSGASSTFMGWIPEGMEATTENVVDFSTYVVSGDANFYAWSKAAQKEFQIQFRTYDGEDELIVGAFNMTKEIQDILGLELRIGDTLKIVSTIPETPESGVQYLTYADLQSIYEGSYTYDNNGTSATLKPIAVPNIWKLHDTAEYSNSDTTRANYVVNSGTTISLPIVAALPAAISSTANPADSMIVYVSLSPNPNIQVTFRMAASQNPDTIENGYALEGTYYTKTITGTFGTNYDFAAQSAGLGRAGCYINWAPATNQGVFENRTYTATFRPAAVTFHFLNESGTDISTYTASGNNPATQGYYATVNVKTQGPADPTKNGYTFQGWNIATLQNGTYTAVDSTLYGGKASTLSNVNTIKPADFDQYMTRTVTDGIPAYDIYLIPSFAVNTFEVKYYAVYSDGHQTTAQTGETQNVQYGAEYTVGTGITEPTATGYTFDGWYGTDDYANKGEKITGFTMDDQAHNLYGFFVPENYPVNFHYNYDRDPEIYTTPWIAFNAAITAPANPTRPGYNFVGWGESADAQAADAIDFANNPPVLTSVDGDDFYAIWEAADVPYIIEYYTEAVDGSYALATLTDAYTGTVATEVTLTAEQKEAQLIEGFSLNDNHADKVYTGTIPATGIFTFKVYMMRNEYTVTFDSAGGSAVAPITAKYGAALTAPEAPTKTGFTFGGWTPALAETMPVGGQALTAIWNRNSYQFTVDLNGGSFASGDTDPSGEYEFEAAVPQLSIPVMTGYTFTGWDVAYPATMPAEAVTVTAQWQINQYTVTVNPDGGTIANLASGWVESSGNYTYTGDYQSAVPALAAPTREGYYLTTDWTNAIPETVPLNGANITASWQLETYRIAFNAGDGTVTPDSKTVAYGQTTTYPEAELEGYTFEGWFTQSEGGTQYTDQTVIGDLGDDVTGDASAVSLTLYAHYSVNSYELKFLDWDNTVLSSETVVYGTAVTAPAAPDNREGWRFVSWDNEVPATMPATALTFKAVYEVLPFTITVDPAGGEIETLPTGWTAVDGKYVFEDDFGANVTPLGNPVRAGYDFNAWSAAIPATVPSQDVEIAASWTKHVYHIEYAMDGGTPQIASTTAEFGETINLPVENTDFTKTGHTFSGWKVGTDVFNGTYTVPAQQQNGDTILLTAQWDINTYTITFNSMGGSAVASIEEDYGTPIAAPAAPTKTGYDFGGWYENEDCTGTAYVFTTMPASSQTLYAKWNEHKYDVVFVQPDESAGDPTFNNLTPYEDYTFYDVNFNSTMSGAPAQGAEVTYFNFTFWSTDSGDSAVEIADITLWTPADFITAENDAAIRANGNTIVIYPHYERVEVQIVMETTSDAVITDRGATEGVSGYIYGAGSRLNKARLTSQLKVEGDGHIEIIASKGSQICGTGTKIILIDDYDNTEKAVYYLIVPGDVNGDAVCNANDVNIAEHTLTQVNRNWYLKDSADDTAEQLAEKQRIRNCYELAADVAESYGTFDDLDTALMELYVFRAVDYEFDSQEVRYYTEEI